MLIQRDYKKLSLKTEKYSINYFWAEKNAKSHVFGEEKSHVQWVEIQYRRKIL